MKLDEKIRERRTVYFLNGEAAVAFEVALLYAVLAKRRQAEEKIADACLKACRWLKRAGIEVPAAKLETIEKILVQNKGLICQKGALVRAIPAFCRG
jgi:site-specific recombinase